jgi:carboxylate-amine ligase
LTAEELVAVFEAVDPLTIGVEEEVMLLDPVTLDLASRAHDVLAALEGDERFKSELPATQLEIVTPPAAHAVDAILSLGYGRRKLAEACEGLARPAAVGVHPFASSEGELVDSRSYREIRDRYEPVLRRQLVASLHVHVALGSARTTLLVHNALRGFLPEIAALAANAAFHQGRDTGMASIRPTIARSLPRQGVPPVVESWDSFAAGLRWGNVAGAMRGARTWWWELRPNVRFGTLEVRVPDAQTTVTDAAAITAFVHALVACLAARADEGELPEAAPGWRIDENRWSAARDGVAGEMADLESGRPEPTRTRLERMLETLEPFAERLGSAPLLALAVPLMEANGAMRQRAVVEESGIHGLAGWLAERFLLPGPVS